MKRILISLVLLIYGPLTIGVAQAADPTSTNPFDVCNSSNAGTLAGCQDSTLKEPQPGHVNAAAKNSFINTYLPNAVTQIALIAAALCIIMLLYAGLMYITNMDNPKEVSTATDIAVWSIIGLFIAMGAYLIMYVINNIF